MFATQIERLKTKGVLSGSYDTQAGLREFFLARDLYYEMKDFETRADDLFARASGMELSPAQADLIAQAQHHYDIYNFYDAFRVPGGCPHRVDPPSLIGPAFRLGVLPTVAVDESRGGWLDGPRSGPRW